MIKNILKRIGRLFITLDRQDVRTNWQDIKNILIISIPPEEHLWRALCIVTEKFKKADFKIILPDSKRTLVPDIVTRENVFGVASHAGIYEYSKEIEKLNWTKIDSVVVLSLDPFLIWRIYTKFKCPKLLYNNAGEWYLIRRKAYYECLRGTAKCPLKIVQFCIQLIGVNLYILTYCILFGSKRYLFQENKISDKIFAEK